MKPKNPPPNFKIKKRITIFSLVFLVILSLLTIRTGYIQVIDGPQLKKEAVEQQTRDRILTSKRGTIYDRNLKPLAISSSAETITASPQEIQKINKVAETAKILSDILELDYNKVLAQLSKNNSYEVVARKIEKDKSNQIREAKLTGITIVEDSKRYYPYSTFASTVIGFTGVDNQGLSGIELAFDKELKGLPGRIISAKNAVGTDMPYQYEKNIAPENGNNIVLTIDETIQHFVEKHLKTAAIENKLKMGAASIVMNAKTGEILAMATEPSFDLNSPFTLSDDFKTQIVGLSKEEQQKAQNNELQRIWRNKAISDTYEPGSTFKILTSAMALEENVASLTDNFYCGGSKHVGNYNISCWKPQGHGSQTFAQGVQNSCNVVFMEVGARVGAKNFYEYMKLFGFMDKTDFDLSGEANGLFHDPKNFNEVELATSSFGQSFQVTPLQLVTAVDAVCNKGMMLRPHIIKAITDPEGNIVQSFDKTEVRQVVSPETSKTLCSVLEKVVSEGTGGNAYVRGYRVAGKTGTSEKLPRGSGKRIASFVGFAPADDPEIVCLVMLDEPTGGEYFGGIIAAPVCGRIMEDTLKYLKVEPKYDDTEIAECLVPEVRNLSTKDAIAKLRATNIGYTIKGNGATVVNQMPRQGTSVSEKSVVILYTEEVAETTVTVPNVIGQNIYTANKSLTDARLNLKIVGAGGSTKAGAAAATKQDPPAGTVLPAGSLVRVEFRKLDVAVD